jgi:hypothetical protein
MVRENHQLGFVKNYKEKRKLIDTYTEDRQTFWVNFAAYYCIKINTV